MAPSATYEEIRGIAQQAVSIFADYGYDCCLFGSTACALYGATRRPNDVDLIVLTNEDTEDLKRILVNEDSRFFLVPSRNPRATYEVLWYTLPSGRNRRRRTCKVDILTPGGNLDLPHVPRQHIKREQQLPVMPLLPLLLTKLRGWTDHRDSHRQDMQDKQWVDVEDIDELLAITCNTRTHITKDNLRWLPEDFVAASQERALEYVEEYPNSALYWETLGFHAYE
ncbi:uncharacterized protein LAESUDRAFT_649859 [Laetiporus sulphureus 93-53]|uniref:Nucleotidyltransferase n=1 Tax=Laetiporus sulphureus 93-53 TaxID=1314785 RepID=A0A165F2B2_9APHY|nr:uncharacterized protein LAESUDRAFT_649859 [Laetiporus sulphureus 93-53]KZT08224.1 hypothetical protein LAESUDRAFT_649859 [Laetiporus sulphureus 93-53]